MSFKMKCIIIPALKRCLGRVTLFAVHKDCILLYYTGFVMRCIKKVIRRLVMRDEMPILMMCHISLSLIPLAPALQCVSVCICVFIDEVCLCMHSLSKWVDVEFI